MGGGFEAIVFAMKIATSPGLWKSFSTIFAMCVFLTRMVTNAVLWVEDNSALVMFITLVFFILSFGKRLRSPVLSTGLLFYALFSTFVDFVNGPLSIGLDFVGIAACYTVAAGILLHAVLSVILPPLGEIFDSDTSRLIWYGISKMMPASRYTSVEHLSNWPLSVKCVSSGFVDRLWCSVRLLGGIRGRFNTSDDLWRNVPSFVKGSRSLPVTYLPEAFRSFPSTLKSINLYVYPGFSKFATPCLAVLRRVSIRTVSQNLDPSTLFKATNSTITRATGIVSKTILNLSTTSPATRVIEDLSPIHRTVQQEARYSFLTFFVPFLRPSASSLCYIAIIGFACFAILVLYRVPQADLGRPFAVICSLLGKVYSWARDRREAATTSSPWVLLQNVVVGQKESWVLSTDYVDMPGAIRWDHGSAFLSESNHSSSGALGSGVSTTVGSPSTAVTSRQTTLEDASEAARTSVVSRQSIYETACENIGIPESHSGSTPGTSLSTPTLAPAPLVSPSSEADSRTPIPSQALEKTTFTDLPAGGDEINEQSSSLAVDLVVDIPTFDEIITEHLEEQLPDLEQLLFFIESWFETLARERSNDDICQLGYLCYVMEVLRQVFLRAHQHANIVAFAMRRGSEFLSQVQFKRVQWCSTYIDGPGRYSPLAQRHPVLRALIQHEIDFSFDIRRILFATLAEDVPLQIVASTYDTRSSLPGSYGYICKRIQETHSSIEQRYPSLLREIETEVLDWTCYGGRPRRSHVRAYSLPAELPNSSDARPPKDPSPTGSGTRVTGRHRRHGTFSGGREQMMESPEVETPVDNFDMLSPTRPGASSVGRDENQNYEAASERLNSVEAIQSEPIAGPSGCSQEDVSSHSAWDPDVPDTTPSWLPSLPSIPSPVDGSVFSGAYYKSDDELEGVEPAPLPTTAVPPSDSLFLFQNSSFLESIPLLKDEELAVDTSGDNAKDFVPLVEQSSNHSGPITLDLSVLRPMFLPFPLDEDAEPSFAGGVCSTPLRN